MKFQKNSLKSFLVEYNVGLRRFDPRTSRHQNKKKVYAEKCRHEFEITVPKVQAKITKLEFHFNELWLYNSTSFKIFNRKAFL